MSPAIKRLLPKTIAAQMSLLAVGAVLLGVLLTFAVMLSLAGNPKMRMNPDLKVAAEAARIATVVREAEAAGPAADLGDIMAGAQSPGGRIARLSAAKLSPRSERSPARDRFTHAVALVLQKNWAIEPLDDVELPGRTDLLFVQLKDGGILQFQSTEYQTAQTFLIAQAGIVLSVMLLVVLAMTVYAVRSVIRPLSAFAETARAFGRSSAGDRPLAAGGPVEIARVADALNDMRKRVRGLMDERTRMLAAISHDLRTPLTRLRLRSDRIADAAERASMLKDIASIDGMIRETLAYLRDAASSEPAELADLPSLLQTLCAEFADIGHDVRYAGPGRLALCCRSRALTRALSNVIDNGVKHGETVVVTLRAPAANVIRIEIADDGPGIPLDLRETVFEPFFKADSARSQREGGGFGLGLSITRDIVERQGGQVVLESNLPRGLVVHIDLPMPAI